jgi:hypothetical protein
MAGEAGKDAATRMDEPMSREKGNPPSGTDKVEKVCDVNDLRPGERMEGRKVEKVPFERIRLPELDIREVKENGESKTVKYEQYMNIIDDRNSNSGVYTCDIAEYSVVSQI